VGMFMKIVMTVIVWLAVFVPTIIGFKFWSFANPESFWEIIAAIGLLGCWGISCWELNLCLS
jgi:hypothetical protein